MEYFAAEPDVVALVATIADVNHKHLDGHAIAVLMQDKATTTGGRTVFGRASLPPAKIGPILDREYDFVICLAADEWQAMDQAKREAVVDHELCHCNFDHTGKPIIVPHDYEEFAAVIERHGFWRSDRAEAKVQGVLLKQGVTVGTVTSTKRHAAGE